MKKGFVVAIDGPAGAGKSTVAKQVAAALHFAYIDTGAMYRAVTWKFLQSGQDFNPALAGKIAATMKITFANEQGQNKVFADGLDISEAIRSSEVNHGVSRIAAVGTVREAMVAQQRRLGQEGNVVLDGRDIGTVVFPHADCKIFLTASVEERARRRYQELQAKGQQVELTEIQKDIAARDKQDTERTLAPLKQAPDAVLLDTSSLDIGQAAAAVLQLVKEHA